MVCNKEIGKRFLALNVIKDSDIQPRQLYLPHSLLVGAGEAKSREEIHNTYYINTGIALRL